MTKKRSSVKRTYSKTAPKKSKFTHKKRAHKSYITQTSTEVKVEKILIENFVSLQKVMANLSIKFDNLANQISKLLELFEISAKTLAEKDFGLEKDTRDNKKIIEKMDNLLDQNKTIAKGLTLIHERIPGQDFSSESFQESPQESFQTPPPKIRPQPRQGPSTGYQKSIISPESSLKEKERERQEFSRF